MPRYKKQRQIKNLKARQVAEAVGVDEGLYSKFENYRAIPIPADFEKILDVLECEAIEIYEPKEVSIFPTKGIETTGGARVNQNPTEYKLTVRLPNNSREILTREVLQKCGYKSISDWLRACLKRLKNNYEIILKAEKKKAPSAFRNKGKRGKSRG